MPANITFTEFTSSTVLFENKEAANAFFHDITVPNATATTFGVVKKSAFQSFTPAAYDNEDDVALIIDGVSVSFPTLAHAEAIKTRLEALEVSYAALLTKLQNAALMATS
jgi:hypothetical protein